MEERAKMRYFYNKRSKEQRRLERRIYISIALLFAFYLGILYGRYIQPLLSK